MGTHQLRRMSGIEVAPPADEVALAVAEALLPDPVPAALVEFFQVSNGARLGAVEVFDVDGVTDATSADAHTWQLPGTVIVGRAGPGRALVMWSGRDEVWEVDDTWDSRTVVLAADTPLELFTRHHGLPIDARERWWAHPALGAAIGTTRQTFARDVDALLTMGIGAHVGEPLPASLVGFRSAVLNQVGDLLDAETFTDELLNHRPAPPAPGLSAKAQWGEACEEILDPQLRDRIRGAELPTTVPGLDRPIDDEDFTLADVIRDHAFLCLVAKARDDLAVRAGGHPDPQRSPAALAQVHLSGHIPISFVAAL